eukprot:151581-Rhodomonas_salina.1
MGLCLAHAFPQRAVLKLHGRTRTIITAITVLVSSNCKHDCQYPQTANALLSAIGILKMQLQSILSLQTQQSRSITLLSASNCYHSATAFVQSSHYNHAMHPQAIAFSPPVTSRAKYRSVPPPISNNSVPLTPPPPPEKEFHTQSDPPPKKSPKEIKQVDEEWERKKER